MSSILLSWVLFTELVFFPDMLLQMHRMLILLNFLKGDVMMIMITKGDVMKGI